MASLSCGLPSPFPLTWALWWLLYQVISLLANSFPQVDGGCRLTAIPKLAFYPRLSHLL
jgi:hypothetical protein